MFGFQLKRKNQRAIRDWIVEKWEFSHTGTFTWHVEFGGMKVAVERTLFGIAFDETTLEIRYTEIIRHTHQGESLETRILYTFAYQLDKIARVEALNAPNIDQGFWGKPILDLGVELVPYEHAKAMVKTTVSQQFKLGPEGALVALAPAKQTAEVLERGFIYLGNGADLHLRGKSAFEDLVRMAGGLRRKEELY